MVQYAIANQPLLAYNAWHEYRNILELVQRSSFKGAGIVMRVFLAHLARTLLSTAVTIFIISLLWTFANLKKYKTEVYFLVLGLIVSIIFGYFNEEMSRKAEMGTLTVYSIPTGAEIFVAPEGTLESKNYLGLKPKIGSEESLVGKTNKNAEPFEKLLIPGFYDVGVKVSAARMRKILNKSGNLEFEPDGTVGTMVNFDPSGSGKAISYMSVYQLWITSGRNTTLVALYQPKNMSFPDLVKNTALFPARKTFTMNEKDLQGLTNTIIEEGARRTQTADMLDLLLRGGKLVWKTDAKRFKVINIASETRIFTYNSD